MSPSPRTSESGRTDSILAARKYLRRGFYPVHLPRGRKGPVLRGWQKLRLKESELEAHFGNGTNVGLLLGDASGLVDIDLDCDAARRLAPTFLPATGMIHGRPGSQRSHWWYAPRKVPDATIRFRDPGGATLLELRSTGGQTMVPPSVHPSGELLAWETFEEPAKVELREIESAARRLAAACLVARAWPAAGARQEAALALAGGLLRRGWSSTEVTTFVRAVAGEAGDEEAEKRSRAALDTARAFEAGEKTTGIPSLAQILGDPVARQLRKFLPRSPRAGSSRAGDVCADERVLDPSAPLVTARRLLADRHELDGTRLLHHHQGEFFGWSGSCYVACGEDGVKSEIYRFLEGALAWKGRGTSMSLEPFKPNSSKVGNVLDALRAASYLDERIAPPAWLAPATGPAPRDLVSCRNGLLELSTGRLLPHNPAFFTVNALDFDYEPEAEPPRRWLDFLGELWSDDEESVAALQEWMGLVALTDATEYQKILLLVGPKRSGKGTIGRILSALAGAANVCAPTLASLGTNFGLWPLIGKRLALISDARLGGRVDQHLVVERLLSISGEDQVTVDRKYKDPWTGRLPVRFVVLTNELPKLADASGAIASRFIVLSLTRSFYGKEDPRLLEKLLPELPGILVWAREGLLRLRARGRLLQPASAMDIVEEFGDLGSPITAFLRDRCTLDPEAHVEVGVIYDAWKEWCAEHGRDHPGTAQSFGRDLRAAVPGLRSIRPRAASGDRFRAYAGIRLLNEWERPESSPERQAGPRWSAVPPIVRDGEFAGGRGEERREKHNRVGRGPSRTTPPPMSPEEEKYAREERLGIQEYGG